MGNGQPACFDDSACGPCAGICPFGIVRGGEVANITDSELSVG